MLSFLYSLHFGWTHLNTGTHTHTHTVCTFTWSVFISISTHKLHAVVFVLFYFTTSFNCISCVYYKRRTKDVLLGFLLFCFLFFPQRDSTSRFVANSMCVITYIYVWQCSRESVAIDAETEWLLKFKAYINIPHTHKPHSLTCHAMHLAFRFGFGAVFVFRCALFFLWLGVRELNWAELY